MTIILNGNNFSSLKTFYDEIERKFTKDLGWEIGRNLDAFNDVLRGGFGLYEYEEQITIIWENSSKSKSDLGYEETIRYMESKLKTCHPTNIASVESNLTDLRLGTKLNRRDRENVEKALAEAVEALELAEDADGKSDAAKLSKASLSLKRAAMKAFTGVR